MPRHPRFRLSCCLMIVSAGLLWRAPAARSQAADDPLRFAHWLIEDGRALPGALAGPVLLPLGLGVAGVAGVSTMDASLAADLQQWHRRELWRVVEEFGDANAMRPAAVIVFVGSLLQDDHRVQDAAFTGLQALILANLVTNMLKAAGGRARPWQDRGADDWEPFSGRTSFPSGHATTAFALMTPWVVYFPGPVAWLGMGVATATSLSRVTLRYHWPSDVLAGAMIGSGISYWLANRHRRSARDAFALAAEPADRVRLTGGFHPLGASLRLSF